MSVAAAPLPTSLYSADAVRSLDHYLINTQGIAGAVLMKRAGRFAFECLTQHWPEARKLHIVCGAGNNGGDGYVVAALAQARGFEVSLRWLADPQSLSGDARRAADYAIQEGVSMAAFDAGETLAADVLVDGLLGTGLNKPVSDRYAAAIAWLNQHDAPVLALDLPSGIHADTGAVQGAAVQAALTTTFVGLKLGLFTGAGRQAAGRVRFSDLDGDTAGAGVTATAERLEIDRVLASLPARAIDSHKLHYGHLAVVGGDNGLNGAAIIAAEAGLRAGAGMVSLVSRPLTAQIALTRRPELMALGVDAGIDAEPKLAQATALVVGPGLGQAAWGEQLLQQALKRALPTVLDADALNLLAVHPVALPAASVITPHPGEAGRLLGTDTATVQADRPAAAVALAQKYGCVAVLKGAGSIIATPEGKRYLVDAGNPGMASGGMGDLLAGIIGALLAQGLSALDAACLGALVHALAGDEQATIEGERGLLATDLLASVRGMLNAL